MAAEHAQEKTDPASPWKRRELRKRGDVPKSQDINAVVGFLAVLLLLHAGAQPFLGRIVRLVEHEWQAIDRPVVSPDNLGNLVTGWSLTFFDLMWPLLLVSFLAGMIANVLQVGFLLTGDPLKMDLQRINPFLGLKRLFSLPGLQGLLQAILKTGAVGYIAYRSLASQLPQVAVLPYLNAGAMVVVVEAIAFRLFINCGLALFVLAAADYAFRRWQWERDKRMSKQETKEEYKRHEGDPTVRQRIKQKQRELAMRRMMAEVPESDVVITNPIHVAIALRYDADRMPAPLVVAKGQRLIAERIKDLARQHGIPIVANPPLARSLHDAVPVGGEIPERLYRAVAEVLAYVYRLRGRTPFRRAV